MPAEEVETILMKDGKRYVTLEVAAQYLGISKHYLENLIQLEKIQATKIEARQLIEPEALKAFADKRKPKVTRWDRID